MTTLKNIEDLFQCVKSEEDINNLQEHKLNISIELGRAHEELHNGNYEKSNTMAVIKSLETLREIINDRIYDVRKHNNVSRNKERQQSKAEEKQYNIELSNLGLACKKMLPRATYKALIECAKTMPHSEIMKLKEIFE